MIDTEILADDPDVLLSFMRTSRRPVFHNSNIFLRDLQFAIQDYYEAEDGVTIAGPEAERLARETARAYEDLGIFKRVNPQGYLLNYPQWVTPKGGTFTMLHLNGTPLPPAVDPMALLAAQQAAAQSGTAPKKVAPAKAATPTDAGTPAASAATSTAPASAGGSLGAGIPAGAKVTPPWLKKK